MKFVSKDLALKLKEKGFKEECLSYYTTEYTLYNNKIALTDDKYLCLSEIDYEEFLVSHNSIKYTNVNYVDAPTIEQVLEWLREDCGLYISMACSRNYDIDADGRELGSWVYWWYEIYAHLSANLIYQEEEKEYETYDEAILEGIEYVINNLI